LITVSLKCYSFLTWLLRKLKYTTFELEQILPQNTGVSCWMHSGVMASQFLFFKR